MVPLVLTHSHIAQRRVLLVVNEVNGTTPRVHFLGYATFAQVAVGYHFGVGAPPIVVHSSGDWDVH